jgi:hypothetical protein
MGGRRSDEQHSYFDVELNPSAICWWMAHDVFISHAHKDKRIVGAICKKLESAQVKCWIAERDISVGEDWTEATRNAIASSSVVVLVLSEDANAAPHIEREIAHAFYTKRAILPVRLTQTPPKRDFLFYLENVRWFDAITSPPEQHLEELAANINGIVHGRTLTRDIKLPHSMAAKERKALKYSDSWVGGLRASHYGALEILKRVTIVAFLLAAAFLLWFVYSRMNLRASLPESDVPPITPAHGTAAHPIPKGTADPSPSKPTYTFSRLGLWVPTNASATPSPEERPYQSLSITAPTPSASTQPSPEPNVSRDAADDKERSVVRDNTSGKPLQPADIPLPSPTVTASTALTPPKTQTGGSADASPDEQSLKELVLEYLRTVATDDGSKQERLFAGRVSFYGKGVLSFPEIVASMERYHREWPIRTWEPKGEPQFPNNLHASNPDLYEVLQPFDWTVANGSQHKQGSAILYLRIRKAENGAFHIFHLEQRHP